MLSIETASLRSRMKAGERVSGIWLMSPSVEFAELVRHVGLDFVVIDLEHGLHSLDSMTAVLRGLEGGKTSAIVRVPNHDPSLIARVLDRGADGIMVPKVPNAAIARQVADAARFPPTGTRGLAIKAIRASGYGHRETYREGSDEATLVIVQVETGEAVKGAEAIANTPGVDMVFIGPSDLSADLRLEGPDNAEAFATIVDDLSRRLRDTGRFVGAMPAGSGTPERLAANGVQLIVLGSDIGIMNAGLLGQLQLLRSHGF